jgi:predicted HAD superfamily Cof-like phosphohydrolase
MTEFQMVGEFHSKFGLQTAGESPPAAVDPDTFMFRYQFLLEELHELLAAYRRGDLPGVADALADLVYVAHGTAHMMRVPLDRVFSEVQRANMEKVRASGSDDGRSKRGSALDVVKPHGWTPPDVAGVLRLHGWKGVGHDHG